MESRCSSLGTWIRVSIANARTSAIIAPQSLRASHHRSYAASFWNTKNSDNATPNTLTPASDTAEIAKRFCARKLITPERKVNKIIFGQIILMTDPFRMKNNWEELGCWRIIKNRFHFCAWEKCLVKYSKTALFCLNTLLRKEFMKNLYPDALGTKLSL